MQLIEYTKRIPKNNMTKKRKQDLLERISKIESDRRKSYVQRESEIALHVILELKSIELAEIFLYWRYRGLVIKDYFVGLDDKGNEVWGISFK